MHDYGLTGPCKRGIEGHSSVRCVSWWPWRAGSALHSSSRTHEEVKWRGTRSDTIRRITSRHVTLSYLIIYHYITSYHITLHNPTPHHTTPLITAQQHTSLSHMSSVAAAVMRRTREIYAATMPSLWHTHALLPKGWKEYLSAYQWCWHGQHEDTRPSYLPLFLTATSPYRFRPI